MTLGNSKGIISFGAYESEHYGGDPVSGVSVTVSPALSSSIIFMDATGNPDQALTSTSSIGLGSVANVEPGDYELTFSHDTKSCTLMIGEGWSGTTASSAKVRVLADYATWLWFVCK